MTAAQGKVKLRTPDGVLGHFAGEPAPSIDVGETIDVWIANVGQDSYTLTLRQEIAARLAPPAGRTTSRRRPTNAGPPKDRPGR